MISPGEGETVFEYGNMANNPKCNLDLNYLILDADFAGSPIAGMLGFLGKPSAKMVSGETWSYTYDGEELPPTVYTYTRQTDAQGFITKITIVETYSGETFTMEHTISYR